ncbi:hypothetical protein TanjilG_20584 [Lupinus angustifolius]|uniref:Clathrin/coatomer adaptor adaptin-like N-terminal domain-containing protein n=1 Tax=Lupinus angustifolius TaxID=3871 RepID=A0A4P1QR94_LUPAN|nr:hypothetical protein TanjilG_20584 [Lupinus angustifolius]
MGAQSKELFYNHSKEFLDLIKSIGKCRSKSEEDRIITHHDAIQLKRTGYLAITLFLNDNHDLIIFIVNTIQKDLKSDNYLVVCAALNAVCRLINETPSPRCCRRKRLCDNALCSLFDLVTVDVDSYKDLVVSFVNILKQVVDRGLPKNYDYHQMPAPFIQVKLLKILALLGSGDKKTSQNMYAVLGDIIRKSDSSTNIGNAVLYECIRCVSSIYSNPKLLEAAAHVIEKILKSDNHNVKYMGIDALGRLIKLSPNIAEQHQLAVIDCLEILEGLLDPSISITSNNTGAATNVPDIMTLYAETTASVHSGSSAYSVPVTGDNLNLLSELLSAAVGVTSAKTIVTPSIFKGFKCLRFFAEGCISKADGCESFKSKSQLVQRLARLICLQSQF